MDIITALIDIDGYSFGLGYFVGLAYVFYLANQSMRENILISSGTGIGAAIFILVVFK